MLGAIGPIGAILRDLASFFVFVWGDGLGHLGRSTSRDRLLVETSGKGGEKEFFWKSLGSKLAFYAKRADGVLTARGGV